VVSSTPRPHITLGKDPVPILQEAGWAPGPVWTGGKSRPQRVSISDRPARSSVAIPTELPGPQIQVLRFKKKFKFKVSERFLTFLRNKVLAVVPVELDVYILTFCSYSINERSHTYSSNSPIHYIRVSKHF